MSTINVNVFETVRSNQYVGFIGSISFALLLAISSQIILPLSFSPVPITLQTAIVLASGFVLGSKYGPLSTVLYLILGAVGLPFFAGNKSGIEHLFGSTSGYLFGFIIASYFSGKSSEMRRSRNNKGLIMISITSTAIIYLFGLIGLIITLNLSVVKAIEIGLLPFIPGDVFKLILVLIVTKPLLPNEETKIDQKEFKSKINRAIASFVILVVYILYLFSNGFQSPRNLMIVSPLIALMIYYLNR